MGPVVGRRLELCENMTTVSIGGAPRRLSESVFSSVPLEYLQALEREQRSKFEISHGKNEAESAKTDRDNRNIMPEY